MTRKTAAGKTNPPPAVDIFLDMDGVIADFDGHTTSHGKRLPNGKADYDALDKAWWVSMPAYPGARTFYDGLKTCGRVKFLSGPVPHPDSFSGKAEWILKFVPEKGRFILRDLILCPTDDKRFLAAPGRILVDDRLSNIHAWQQAGGIGILHQGDFAATLAEVRKAAANLGAATQPEPPLGTDGPAGPAI